MISILFEINEIDAGKWFQIVMTGLTLEILFILVSVMSKRKKPRYEASPVTPVQSETESEAEESVGGSSIVYDGAVGPNPPTTTPVESEGKESVGGSSTVYDGAVGPNPPTTTPVESEGKESDGGSSTVYEGKRVRWRQPHHQHL